MSYMEKVAKTMLTQVKPGFSAVWPVSDSAHSNVMLAKEALSKALDDNRRSGFRVLIEELVAFRTEQRISDEDLAELLELAVNRYVEDEVNSKLSNLFASVAHDLGKTIAEASK